MKRAGSKGKGQSRRDKAKLELSSDASMGALDQYGSLASFATPSATKRDERSSSSDR